MRTHFVLSNTCNGPDNYVDHLMKDPSWKDLKKLWVGDCFEQKGTEAAQYVNATFQNKWQGKHLNLNMNWVSYAIVNSRYPTYIHNFLY